MRRVALFLALGLAGCGTTTPSSPPERPVAARADEPARLATEILDAFAATDTVAFDSLYPFPHARGMLRFAASRDIRPIPGIARVVAVSADASAIIALSGHLEFGNTGDETTYAEAFSGLYEVRPRADGRWTLTRRIPLDSLSRAQSQSLDVRLDPGAGMRIRDSLVVTVEGAAGFAATLNHAARIESVRNTGGPARGDDTAQHAFAGGLLWIDVPPGTSSIVIDYVLDVARDSATDANSARFTRDFGHVRNQYHWHPGRVGWSTFDLTVRAPSRVHVASDLPQSDTVIDGVRVVRARSAFRAAALSLVYDAEWSPVYRRAGNATLALFASPDFDPSADSIIAAFTRTYDLLADRFAAPSTDYFVVAQQRARAGRGWLWRSNDMIGAAASGSAVLMTGPPPRASFGHEVAHGWITPTGPASNFLGEGWAMLVESMLIEDALGREHAERFWAHRRNLYYLHGFEGRQSLLDDPANSGIAYTKGSWVLRMLRDYVGEEAFADGMRSFMTIERGDAAGLEQFTAAMSEAAGRDIGTFLRPWIAGTSLPRIDARIEAGRVVLEQTGEIFVLPLEVDLLTSEGPIRRALVMDRRVVSIPARELGPVHSVIVDPEQRLLSHRERGERVRFDLHAPAAREVMLVPDFSREPLRATLDDGVWSVTVPLSAGIYLYDWRVDGSDRDGGVRHVRPLEALPDMLPR